MFLTQMRKKVIYFAQMHVSLDMIVNILYIFAGI